MRYVLDSSVAFKWVVPEADSAKAQGLRQDYQNSVHQLVASDIFPFEIAHALTRAERQGRITTGEALVLWLTVMADAPALVPALPLTQRAIEISSQLRVGVYDCLYVALAEQEACQLVTADSKLAKNLQSMFPFIIELASFP